MPHCCAWNCSNQYSSNINISYHRLPSDKKVADAWKKNISRTELPNQVYVCSDHFEESCFDASHDLKQRLMPSASGRASRKIIKGAIPTIFAHRKPENERTSSANRAHRREKTEVNSFLSLSVLSDH